MLKTKTKTNRSPLGAVLPGRKDRETAFFFFPIRDANMGTRCLELWQLLCNKETSGKRITSQYIKDGRAEEQKAPGFFITFFSSRNSTSDCLVWLACHLRIDNYLFKERAQFSVTGN